MGKKRKNILQGLPAFPVLCLISSTETEDAIALLFVFFAPYRTERGACWNAREFTVKNGNRHTATSSDRNERNIHYRIPFA